MSPEQAEGRAAGPEADVYSLALTLYECWSGENPNRRSSPAATARAIGARPRPLRRLRPDLPRELTDAVDACLSPRPGRRPALEELGTAIEDSLDHLAEHPRHAPRPLRMRLGALAAAAALGAWLAVGHGVPAAVGFQPVPRPEEPPPARQGATDQRSTQPRVSDRRPRRGGLQPRLQLRGAAGRAGPQAGQGDGRPQDRLGRPRLRPQRVHGLPLQAGPRPSWRGTSARSSRSCPATCWSTRAAAAMTC